MANTKKNNVSVQKDTVTREHLARSIKKYTGLNIGQSSELVDKIISILSDSICARKHVKIRMFGTFITRVKGARMGRNPKTMVEAPIAAREVIKFTTALTLKKKINKNISSVV